jgi:diguanylate cyclase (GGDEF)-like protein
MPNVDGWEVAKQIRTFSEIPIIMMSALSTEEDLLRGYDLKVDDYITKPFNPKVLVAKSINLLERIKKLELNKELTEILDMDGIKINMASYGDKRKLNDLLIRDELTKVYNRKYLDFQIKNIMKEAIEFNSTFGILFFDIDHFKNVNDTYGHNIGDEVLKMVSSTINSNIRNIDILGRWGGEEFIAIVRVDKIDELKMIAEKLRIKVSESTYLIDSKRKISVTISIGGTLFDKNDDISKLISRADSNMYNSKENGRNNVTII